MPKVNKVLSYKKCRTCRRDRQKCLPEDRPWPGSRCTRCEKYGYECSASLTKVEEATAGAADQNTIQTSTPVGQSPDLFDHALLRESGVVGDGKSTKDWRFFPFPNGIEGFGSTGHEIRDRLSTLVKILHARTHQCRIAAKLDEVATIERCLYQQEVSLSSFTNDALQGKCADLFLPPWNPRGPLNDTAQRLSDHYDMVGDFVSALNISRDLYFCSFSSRIDEKDVLREKLENRYQNFRGRVRTYCRSWDFLVELSTLFHFVRGLQCARDDSIPILPRDWHSSLCKQYTPSFYRSSTFYIAVDFDLPNLLAALFQDESLAQISLSAGFRQFLLHVASRVGKYKTACYLIDRGADVNFMDEDDETPLHSACQGGWMELVALLIYNGADINAENFKLQTPLHKLVVEVSRGKGHPLRSTIGRLLLDNGAKPELVDRDGHNALHLAVQAGNLDLVKMLTPRLFQLELLEARGPLGYTPLHLAIQKGWTQVAIFLIKQGHNVNILSTLGASPLHLTCGSPHALETRMVIECLIEHRAEIGISDRFLETPLHLAAGSGNLEAVKTLLENGADRNELNDNGQTPLQLAFSLGHDAICALFTDVQSSGVQG